MRALQYLRAHRTLRWVEYFHASHKNGTRQYSLNRPRCLPHSRQSRPCANQTRLIHQPFVPRQSRIANDESTIFALSTAPGKAAIAVIRISGPACAKVYHALCPGKPLPRPRHAAVRTLFEPHRFPSHDTILDPSALVLSFPGPRTVTGEDVLELHVHGGSAVVKAILKAISACSTDDASIRYAEPGEFTQRGFLNDRLDLTQVEALGDVLSADTEKQRKLSVRGTTGRLAVQYEDWRQELLFARGELEALIDFQEDQHFDESPGVLTGSVAKRVQSLKSCLELHIANAMRGELLRNGISVALLGAPNAGKSSLLNRIVGREAAIVSQEAGTTRDIIEVSVDINGYLCRFGDTAGLRVSAAKEGSAEAQRIGLVETEGIKRAKQHAFESDVVLVMTSIERDAENRFSLAVDAEVIDTAKVCAEKGAQLVFIINKTDLVSGDSVAAMPTLEAQLRNYVGIADMEVCTISCNPDMDGSSSPFATQTGIQGLLSTLTRTFDRMIHPDQTLNQGSDANKHADISLWQESLGASERHRLLLEECVSHLDVFLALVASPLELSASQLDADQGDGIDIVVAAESLRSAADCLARITGRGGAGDVEEVLGVVFAKFCVGK